MIRFKEKKERALGEHLHLKGERCLSPKCAVIRKPYKPGQHGTKKMRKKISEFGRQLAEKQKFKVVYGVNERALRRLYNNAAQDPRPTAQALIELLERRLDNALYRLGVASSRRAARQLVSQGHILVNGKRARTASYSVEKGDRISFREGSKMRVRVQENRGEILKKLDPPSWLQLDAEKLEGKVEHIIVDEIPTFDISLLIQSLSK